MHIGEICVLLRETKLEAPFSIYVLFVRRILLELILELVTSVLGGRCGTKHVFERKPATRSRSFEKTYRKRQQVLLFEKTIDYVGK